MSEFESELDPTAEELRRWASSGDLAPMQDWDLILSLHEPVDELLDLWRNARGPQASFFAVSTVEPATLPEPVKSQIS